MLGTLSDAQVEDLLSKEIVGRIGCHSHDMVYVVPISYVYNSGNIYAHTHKGLKLEIMYKNPNVCFEVDDCRDMGNWQSVIAWGKFEEINDSEEKEIALRLLLNRSLPVVSSETTHLGKSWPFSSTELDSIGGIIFKIVLNSKTGRFENSSDSPAVTG